MGEKKREKEKRERNKITQVVLGAEGQRKRIDIMMQVRFGTFLCGAGRFGKVKGLNFDV